MRTLNIIILTFCMSMAFAQQDSTSKRYVDYGLLRTQGNIAIGTPTKLRGTNMYLGGDLEYYMRGNVSARGACYYFLGNFNGDDILKMNHSGFLGLMYHFPTKSHLDPYAGIQPGYAISQFSQPLIQSNDLEYNHVFTRSPVTVNPLVSASVGFNYYANRFFHLFGHLQYVAGKHFSDMVTQPLNEVKVSFGLGYMIWVRRDHFGFRKPGLKKKDD